MGYCWQYKRSCNCESRLIRNILHYANNGEEIKYDKRISKGNQNRFNNKGDELASVNNVSRQNYFLSKFFSSMSFKHNNSKFVSESFFIF